MKTVFCILTAFELAVVPWDRGVCSVTPGTVLILVWIPTQVPLQTHTGFSTGKHNICEDTCRSTHTETHTVDTHILYEDTHTYTWKSLTP